MRCGCGEQICSCWREHFIEYSASRSQLVGWTFVGRLALDLKSGACGRRTPYGLCRRVGLETSSEGDSVWRDGDGGAGGAAGVLARSGRERGVGGWARLDWATGCKVEGDCAFEFV